jgi:hypothetical protein
MLPSEQAWNSLARFDWKRAARIACIFIPQNYGFRVGDGRHTNDHANRNRLA